MPASYEVGTTLVYPHHGAVTVTGLTTRDIKGTLTKYMTLRVHSSDLIIQAAIDKAADLGVRNVIDQTRPEWKRSMSSSKLTPSKNLETGRDALKATKRK